MITENANDAEKAHAARSTTCAVCVFLCVSINAALTFGERALMKPFSLHAVMEMAVFRLPGCADMPIRCTGDDSSPPSIATVTKREHWR